MTSLAAELVHRINGPDDIPVQLVHDGMLRLLALPDGRTRDVMLGSALTGLLLRGPRRPEVSAAIRAALSLDGTGQESVDADLIAYTGSGKKSVKTFNISTCAALVAAAGGARIAKLGSRSASSLTGSRDFMEYVGVPSAGPPVDEMAAVASDLGFGFFSIEDRIPEFDSRYGGRFQAVHALSLGFPALLSPVRCTSHVYGLAHLAVEDSARLLAGFGLPDVTVIGSQFASGGHVDELIGGAMVRACRVLDGVLDDETSADIVIGAATRPADLASVMQHADPRGNVSFALKVLAGRAGGGARDAVVLNAALLLCVAGVAPTYEKCVVLAADIVRAGAGIDVLTKFIEITGGSGREVQELLTSGRD
ncbi:hypothetical protein [Longispora urticae]